MLSFSLVAKALMGMIYNRPSDENSTFHFTLCLMMLEVSLKTLPKNAMIQDMINSKTNVLTMDVRFCHLWNNFKTELGFFSVGIWNVPRKDVSLCDLCNQFNTKLSFSVAISNVPTKDVSFCLLCNHFNIKLSFSVGIKFSTKDVTFCHLWNHFDTELSF